MALARNSVSRRSSKNELEKDDEDGENNGYIQVFVKPLEQGSCSYLFKWLGVNKVNFSSQQVGVCYGGTTLVVSVLFYQLLRCDVGILFQRLCSLVVPMFCIMCAFYWLSLYFRRTWSNTSIYLLFCSCYMGEFFAQIFFRDWGEKIEENNSSTTVLSNYTTQPLVIVCVLLFISVASVFSSLETSHSAGVILLVSFTRFLACSALQDIPIGLRPFVAYSCGFAGNIVAKYMEALLKPQIQNYTTQDGKIPVIKRRRSSSSSAHAFAAHRSARRTSLPALIQKSQSSTAGYESAILGEAHGLITDMLADSSLPPHIISGLKAVSNLLKPPDAQSSFHKPRVSPLVSLTESTTYGSDSEESPYTGERPSTLPKRLRRSLPPSLIRRMSTSTWTTTTSATGMPTLEPEPCRMRSSSFRHSREGTPGSSPNGSRSNSPSPASVSNSTTILTIPKSRSFSLASAPTVQSSYSRRFPRKSATSESSLLSFGSAPSRMESKQSISPLARTGESIDEREANTVKVLSSVSSSAIIQKRIITSDYESSDSPSSSDHSDNVYTSEDLGCLNKKELLRQLPGTVAKLKEKAQPLDDGEDDKEREGDDEAEDDDDKLMMEEQKDKSSIEKTSEENILLTCISKELKLLFDPEKEIEKNPLLNINQLNQWDFPIFKVADSEGTYLLTKIAYRLFTEVGLMETFRIPLAEFLNYFHALELGYREKPYHNRVHATDVLHGVYYLTTQPIPGFAQINTSDLVSRNGSSSESDNENSDRPSIKHRASFMAEDSYGIMGGNLPALELMALYTAAAMHDYDHPGRTNAFLVATTAPQAVLYNDRSVLENHHAAAAWSLLLNNSQNYFISGLEAAEFKRFRYLVIEAILATDLKRHFEILAEFNAKVNDEDSAGLDWTSETDRLLVTQMVIKLADINGPAKRKDLHQQWTFRIAEEFYEQGDEEASLGLPISPYMDRRSPQLAKLQETFINHLVAPLCNAMVTGGLLPGTWAEEDPQEAAARESMEQMCGTDTQDEDNDTDNESGANEERQVFKPLRKVNCMLTKNLKENYEFWLAMIKKEEEDQKKSTVDLETPAVTGASVNMKEPVLEKSEMEPIKEESESPPLSAVAPPTPPHQPNVVKASQNSAFQSTSSSS
ncbi:cGMP-inhibited 3',5'-cyclic phosphodiesterase 3A-like isoform X2 [Biomphalaria glabrata]|uniref:Phosphodiesterase n=1 Tax=Biomphalaria glabrata TaxID=6526 RepID=A0A2C9JSH9_BIOGL|nr:cGMP-inhibited 3',5'-cyclic phosphodiesterase 3A-like isoform X2 [Biomphalaria glabrata]KAI8791783.1 cGMP-inhibited 3,5-cyclic phosphodiesterase A [Biomphalaria glabrata]